MERRGFLKLLGAALAAPLIEPVARRILVQVPANYPLGKVRTQAEVFADVEARLNKAMLEMQERLAYGLYNPDVVYMSPQAYEGLSQALAKSYSPRNIENLIYKENIWLKQTASAITFDKTSGLWS
jgi:hypothetical protein